MILMMLTYNYMTYSFSSRTVVGDFKGEWSKILSQGGLIVEKFGRRVGFM